MLLLQKKFKQSLNSLDQSILYYSTSAVLNSGVNPLDEDWPDEDDPDDMDYIPDDESSSSEESYDTDMDSNADDEYNSENNHDAYEDTTMDDYGPGDENRLHSAPDELDRDIDIVVGCNNIDEAEEYFDTKREAIERDYNDKVSDAMAELNRIHQEKEALVRSLDGQENDICDFYDNPDLPLPSSPSSTVDPSEVQPEKDETPEIKQEKVETPEVQSDNVERRIVQDSSDVVQTDFDPSDYYED